MTVQELIDELMKIEDKTRTVEIPQFEGYCNDIREISSDFDEKVTLFT